MLYQIISFMPLTRLSIFIWKTGTDGWDQILDKVPKPSDEYALNKKWLGRHQQMVNR